MIDKPLFKAVMIMFTLSLVMCYSLSVYKFAEASHFNVVIKQGIAIMIGLVSIVFLSKLNPDKWFVPIGFSILIVFTILMSTMSMMPEKYVYEIGGAKRWINFGLFSIAPVEFFKIGFVFFLSWSLSRTMAIEKEIGLKDEISIFLPYIIVFSGVIAVVAGYQKDLGQVIVLSLVLITLFVFSGASKKFFSILFGAFILVVILLIKDEEHRINRIIDWWRIAQDTILYVLPFDFFQSLRVESADMPLQITNSLNSIYNGGIFGQGLGNGQFKLGYLTEVHTDFILAGLSEELGFVTLIFATMTIIFIIFRIFKIAAKVENPTYYLFAMGTGMIIAYSFILNAYGIAGITPIKGIAVPFLSYGGSHILASSVSIGMVLMLSKRVPRDEKGDMI